MRVVVTLFASAVFANFIDLSVLATEITHEPIGPHEKVVLRVKNAHWIESYEPPHYAYPLPADKYYVVADRKFENVIGIKINNHYCPFVEPINAQCTEFQRIQLKIEEGNIAEWPHPFTTEDPMLYEQLGGVRTFLAEVESKYTYEGQLRETAAAIAAANVAAKAAAAAAASTHKHSSG